MPSQFLKKIVEVFGGGGGKEEADAQGNVTLQPITMDSIDAMMQAPPITGKKDEDGLIKSVIKLFAAGGGGG